VGPDSIAGLSGPVLSEPPPPQNGVPPVPGRSDEGDVNAATGGSLVPPGVSGGAPPPKDCSNGLGSRLNDPPSGAPKKSGVFVACCWPGRGGGARGLAASALDATSGLRVASCLGSDARSAIDSVGDVVVVQEMGQDDDNWGACEHTRRRAVVDWDLDMDSPCRVGEALPFCLGDDSPRPETAVEAAMMMSIKALCSAFQLQSDAIRGKREGKDPDNYDITKGKP
jgi:hypothetical protein